MLPRDHVGTPFSDVGGVGPQGPQGAPGAAGAAGPQGAQGAPSSPSIAQWGWTTSPSINADRYATNAYSATNATESLSTILVSRPFTLTQLDYRAPALSTDTIVATIRINGVDTAATVTVNPGVSVQQITGLAIAVNNGDRLTLKLRQNGTESINQNGRVSFS